MKFTGISHDGVEVPIEHVDHGIVLCKDSNGKSFMAYVSEFTAAGKTLRSEVDQYLVEASAGSYQTIDRIRAVEDFAVLDQFGFAEIRGL